MIKPTRAEFLQIFGAGILRAAQPAPGKGKWLPSEKRVYQDEETGREIWQMTSSPYDSVNLYFTTRARAFELQLGRPVHRL